MYVTIAEMTAVVAMTANSPRTSQSTVVNRRGDAATIATTRPSGAAGRRRRCHHAIAPRKVHSNVSTTTNARPMTIPRARSHVVVSEERPRPTHTVTAAMTARERKPTWSRNAMIASHTATTGSRRPAMAPIMERAADTRGDHSGRMPLGDSRSSRESPPGRSVPRATIRNSGPARPTTTRGTRAYCAT